MRSWSKASSSGYCCCLIFWIIFSASCQQGNSRAADDAKSSDKYFLRWGASKCFWTVSQSCTPCHFPTFPLAVWLNICLLNRHQNAHTSPTPAYTQPDAHQHQACCCLLPTETYPVFMTACLFLKACSEPLHTNQTEQKGNLWIKLFRDRRSLAVGRELGGLGKRCCLEQQACQTTFLGPLILGEGKGDSLDFPQTVSHLCPGDPFCFPSFCHVALD